MKRPFVGDGGLGAATGSADVEPVVVVAGVGHNDEDDARWAERDVVRPPTVGCSVVTC